MTESMADGTEDLLICNFPAIQLLSLHLRTISNRAHLSWLNTCW